MKIGLIGAPGAGKSQLAQGLVEKMQNDPLIWPKVQPVHVIDDYVPALEQRMDMALKFHTGYLGNLAITMERIGLEQYHRRKNVDGTFQQSLITCGTLIDSLAYTITWFEGMGEILSRNVDLSNHRWRSDAAMDMFSVLFDDSCYYDILFWLPGGYEVGEDVDYIDSLKRNTRSVVNKFKELERLQEVIKLEPDNDAALEAAFGHIEQEFRPNEQKAEA